MLRPLAAAALLLAPAVLSAQSVPDWAAPSELPAPAEFEAAAPPPPPPPPPPVPVDGGLTLLALAGAGYAASKLRRS